MTTHKPQDRQVGGSHYAKMAIQPIDFIVDNDIPYREGNVIKYVVRHRSKNGIEDLHKAQHYIQMLIAEYTATESKAETGAAYLPNSFYDSSPSVRDTVD
jgi:hypothetical protein